MAIADTLHEGFHRRNVLLLNYMSKLISYRTENSLNIKVQQVITVLMLTELVFVWNTALWMVKQVKFFAGCVRGVIQSACWVQFVRGLCMPCELAGCFSVTMVTGLLGLEFIPWLPPPQLCCCPPTYSLRPYSFFLPARTHSVSCTSVLPSVVSHTSEMWLTTLTWNATGKCWNVSVSERFYFKYLNCANVIFCAL
jgi:hypothetical protein